MFQLIESSIKNFFGIEVDMVPGYVPDERPRREIELRKALLLPLDRRPVLSATDAKVEYFLTSEDLQTLVHEHLGFGATRLYKVEELRNLALEKYGLQEFERKREAKLNRANKKRARDEEAHEVILSLGDALTEPASRLVEKAVIRMQASLIKTCKRKIGCVQSGNPNTFRLEKHNISKELFAALIKRPADVELKSVPKHGAYQVITMESTDLLGIESVEDIETEFNGIGYCLDEEVELKYKSAGSILSLHFRSRFNEDGF